jgi:uncharacterized protein with PQ loop repeat
LPFYARHPFEPLLMLLSDILGYLAAFCTTIAFLPQTIQVIRTKDTEALSLSMYSILRWVLFFGCVTA